MSEAEGALSPPGARGGLIWTIAAFAVVGVYAAALLAMGRTLICPCGTIELWHAAANDSGTSQHITDWYAFSHVIHGFLFYGAAHLIGRFRGRAIGFGPALALALVVEGGWELLENSPMIIERYRENTASDLYAGDSVLNSVSDMGAMAIGFVIARLAPVWFAVAAALAMELVALYVIRDNLTLNVLMIVWPLDAIKDWQAMR
jgi:hypothetical protein